MNNSRSKHEDIGCGKLLAGRRLRQSSLLFAMLQVIFCSVFSAIAAAHETRPVIATMNFAPDGGVELTLSLNLEAAIAGIGTQHKDTRDSAAAPLYDRLRGLNPRQLLAEFQRFEPTLKRQFAITIDAKPLAFQAVEVAVPETGDLTMPRITTLTLAGPQMDRPNSLSWKFDPVLGDSVMRVRAGGEKVLRADLVAAGELGGPVDLLAIVPQGLVDEFATYLKHGFVHILPKGLDHIMFVLGLFLLSTRLRSLLWQVSAFTLAHTVTLALGASGAVAISPSFVEPLIAASIVYVGVENLLTDRLHVWRLPTVFGFGLLHGLGFAGVMGEIGLPDAFFFTGLIAFNAGVELGQLAVIAIALVTFRWAAKRPWYRRAVTMPASLAIAAVAGLWVLERTSIL